MKMERHVRVLAVLYASLSFLGLASFGFLLLSDLVVSVTIHELSDAVLRLAPTAVLLTGAMVYLVLNLVAAIALFRRTSWSRSYVLVVGFLNLVNFPFGTALGGYTIWALSTEEARSVLAA